MALFNLTHRSYYSLQDQLDKTANRPSGFDYMRIVLAVAVLAWHTPWLINGKLPVGPISWTYPFALSLVPMFFGLSGFLVAGSLDRSKTLVMFLGLRALRIAPALAVEVLLSAIILGPLFTTETISTYFSSKEFYLYFLNMIGDIHYYLPGVFKTNKHDYVNGQLWTVPFELYSYILVAGLAVAGIFHRRAWLLSTLVLFYAAQVANTILRGTEWSNGFPTGTQLMMAAIAGLVIYKYRDKIPFSKRWFFAAAVLTFLCLSVQGGGRFAALPATYTAVYLGLLNPGRNRLLLSGDYSYGVYLYGFPIQQALIVISPLFSIWYWNLSAALFCAFTAAACSWWLVEKPALGQRDKLKALEGRWLKFRAVLREKMERALAGNRFSTQRRWLMRRS